MTKLIDSHLSLCVRALTTLYVLWIFPVFHSSMLQTSDGKSGDTDMSIDSIVHDVAVAVSL